MPTCPKVGDVICVQCNCERASERANERPVRTNAPSEDSASYREVSPDSRYSDKNIIRIQRAFRCLDRAARSVPRVASAENASSVRPLEVKRSRAGRKVRERADVHRCRATVRSTTIARIVLRRDAATGRADDGRRGS